jgi:tetratricopeptide (TPR) repeat protein
LDKGRRRKHGNSGAVPLKIEADMVKVPDSIRIEDSRLTSCLSSIELAVSDLWKYPILQHYTDHSITHSERIIKALGRLLEKYGSSLNEHERFILLSSVYLHDIGMQSPVHAGLEEKERYSETEEGYIRDRHAETSAKMIKDSSLKLGLEDCIRIAPIIAEICEYHRNLDLGELRDNSIAGEKIRVPLLAGLLRLGDELDADYHRVIMKILKTRYISPDSKYHWWAHHYVTSVGIENEQITLYFTFPLKYKGNKLIEALRGKVENSIRNQYFEIYDLFESYGFRLPRDIKCREDYDEIGLEDIPEDLANYINENVIRLKENSELFSKRNGIILWIDSVPFSDNVEVIRCLNRIYQYLTDEKIREAIREIERCRCFTMGPIERIAFCIAAGISYFISGDAPKSKIYFDDVLAISRRNDIRAILKDESKIAESNALGNIGLVYKNNGDWDRALSYFLDSLKICREIGFRLGEGSDLGNIGLTYQHMGNPDQALKYLQDALEISKEIEFRENEANALNNIGLVYQDKGDLDRALGSFQDALKISREIGFRLGEANALGNIGIIYRAKKDLNEAKRHFQNALKIHHKIGFRQDEASQMANIGGIFYEEKEPDLALKCLQEALKIHQEIGFRQGEALDLKNIALVYQSKGLPDHAIKCLQGALEIFREIGDSQSEDRILRLLGSIREG